MTRHWWGLILIGMLTAAAVGSATVIAQEPETPAATEAAAPPEAPPESTAAVATPPTVDDQLASLKVGVDTLWVMVAAMLVFFMNLGFAAVESGMCRAKNCVNILSKNFIVFAVASIAYWLLGWGLMFGNGNPYVGTDGVVALQGEDNSPATMTDYKGDYGALNWSGIPLWAKFFFQLVFAGTAATIVSGAVAERIKYLSFILFSFAMAIFIYPVVGHWIWGGGWLMAKGFVDFAGSTQVHSIGGWAALTGVIILGPRYGKFGPDGRINAIPAHSFPLATIGCFVLWLGWFGFNPGSTMGIVGDPKAVADIAVTTNTAGAMATLTATLTCWLLLGKPDLGMTLNGCLAGLVAITAPCAFVTVPVSALIGGIAGVLVVLSVLMFDRLRIDDPVGATSVHLVNGVFGTLCVGIFGHPDLIARSANTAHVAGMIYTGSPAQIITQLVGIGATAIYVLVTSAGVWLLLKYTMGIRVSHEEEIDGLDHGEHGNEAYHGFVMSGMPQV